MSEHISKSEHSKSERGGTPSSAPQQMKQGLKSMLPYIKSILTGRLDNKETPKTTRSETNKILRRVFKTYLLPHWPMISIAVFFMVLVAIATSAKAWIMKPVLDDIFLNKNTSMLSILPFIIFAMFAVRGIAEFLQTILMNRVTSQASARVRSQMFRHMLKSDLSFFHNNTSPALVSKFTQVAQGVASTLITTVVTLLKDSLMLLSLSALMIVQDWRMFIFISTAFMVFYLPLTRKNRNVAEGATNKKYAIAGGMAAFLNQSFQGIRQVKAFQMEDKESKKADTFFKNSAGADLKTVQAEAMRRPLVDILAGLAIGLTMAYGGQRVIDGSTTPGSFFAFVTAALIVYRPLKNLSTVGAKVQACVASAKNIFQLIDSKPEVQNRADAKPLPKKHSKQLTVAFHNVVFSYPTKNRGEQARRYALNGIDLHVAEGKTTALVGPSGGGKSTILNLIPRFYDVTDGSIKLNDIDIRDVTLESLRAHIALVSQDIFLMNDTIAANIAYGTGRRPIAAIKQAAENSAAAEFIETLPKGYKTVIGENGVMLSGGQRQRLSIARAMMKDAPILLLDEATSALDSESERIIQESLTKLRANRTTLVIAHRLSTIRNAEHIYVILNGQVHESGTHANLIQKPGIYKKMVTQQKHSDVLDTDTPATKIRRVS